MSTPGYPGDPSLPPPSEPDPNFNPSAWFMFNRPDDVDNPALCTCPGISDDPDCARHGARSR